MHMDELARFILGGTVILVSAEHMAMQGSDLARRFFMSPAWVVLRHLLIGATIALCCLVTVRGTS